MRYKLLGATGRLGMTLSLALCMTVSASAQAGQNNDIVLIPAGQFNMGSDKIDEQDKGSGYGNIKPWYLDEHPLHKVNLPDFYMDRYETTNAQYAAYIKSTGAAAPAYWFKNGYLLSLQKESLKELKVEKLRRLAAKVYRLDMDTRTMSKDALIKAIFKHLDLVGHLPVQYVTWDDADHYCHWTGERLPSEAEWEKAARGNSGREFPWGDDWRPGMSNAGGEQWDYDVAPVGSYVKDKSEFGVFDMAGNVSEWVADWYEPYPKSDYKSEDFGHKYRVVKGAGWGGEGHYALRLFQRAAYRGDFPPQGSYADVGFRCATDKLVEDDSLSAKRENDTKVTEKGLVTSWVSFK